MGTTRFFVQTRVAIGETGKLTEEQTRQARSVLRLGAQSLVTLFDGTGVEATARITSAQRLGAEYIVECVERPDREPPLQLTVGLALLRGERFETAIQKLTELGITRFVPLRTDHCVVSFDVRAWQKRLERYLRIAREAAEQSERVRVPEISAPASLPEFLQSQPVIVLAERGQHAPVAEIALERQMALAVGPEGGWSEQELALIDHDAAGTATLGRLILRAETAAIAAGGTLIQRAWASRPTMDPPYQGET